MLTTATGLGAWGLQACRGRGGAEAIKAVEQWKNQLKQTRFALCDGCAARCGLNCEFVDDRLVGIRGAALHPVNQGAICPKGLDLKHQRLDEDRLRVPLRRKGPRGSGEFEEVSWESALTQVTLAIQSSPQATSLLGGQYRGSTDDLFQTFLQALGSPHYLRLRCLQPELPGEHLRRMQGLDSPVAYDLAGAKVVLSFGCNLFEGWQSPLYQARVLAGDTDLIQIDPRYSLTASKARVWAAPHPGTDGILALGLANILLREGLYDAGFAHRWIKGFEADQTDRGPVQKGFKNLVLQGYGPERVEALTGIPARRLYQIAHLFGGGGPSVALAERGPGYGQRDAYSKMAIHSLNALVGSPGRVGGMTLQARPPLTPLGPALRADNDPLSALEAGEIKTLLLYRSNPLYSSAARTRWAAALDKLDLLVSFATQMDETSRQADLILPDLHSLERWQDDVTLHQAGVSLYSLSSPVVEPWGRGRASEEVVLELARRLNLHSLAFPDYPSLLRLRAEGLFQARRGRIPQAREDSEIQQLLMKQGYWQAQYDDFASFWTALQAQGVWLDEQASYRGRAHLMPQGNFDLRPLLQEAKQPWVAPLHRGGLLLVSFKPFALSGGRNANQSRLLESLAGPFGTAWEGPILLNPTTAKARDLRTGDLARLVSSRGELVGPVKLTEAVGPALIFLPFGLGHEFFGKRGSGRGVNPNHLLADFGPNLVGHSYVELSKVEAG